MKYIVFLDAESDFGCKTDFFYDYYGGAKRKRKTALSFALHYAAIAEQCGCGHRKYQKPAKKYWDTVTDDKLKALAAAYIEFGQKSTDDPSRAIFHALEKIFSVLGCQYLVND